MVSTKRRARAGLLEPLKPPARVAEWLDSPPMSADIPGRPPEPAPAAGLAESEPVEPAAFWPDDELEPGAVPVSAAAQHTSNILPSAGAEPAAGQDLSQAVERQAPEPASAPARRRLTGLYTADEVRALPGELVSIESPLDRPGRFLCVWLESEPGAADAPRRLDGEITGGEA